MPTLGEMMGAFVSAVARKEVEVYNEFSLQHELGIYLRSTHPELKTDRKINPGPPAQRFMRPPLSRYIALAQRRTMALMSRRGPLLEKNHFHGATGVQSERHDPDVLPVRAHGYYVVDSKAARIFNRTVTLRDSWSKN
jgi:hypothetical protein